MRGEPELALHIAEAYTIPGLRLISTCNAPKGAQGNSPTCLAAENKLRPIAQRVGE